MGQQKYEGSMTSTQSFMAGKDQEIAPKRDGLIPSPSSTTSIMLASTRLLSQVKSTEVNNFFHSNLNAGLSAIDYSTFRLYVWVPIKKM